MQFSTLSGYFERLDETTSRNAMTELLSVLLAQAKAEEIGQVCYLALGGLGPAFARIDFQLAEKMVVRALARLSKEEVTSVWQRYKTVGDLGLVAGTLRAGANGTALSVAAVYDALLSIAQEEGSGSQERKLDGLVALLSKLPSQAAKYVVRIVMGRLRLGFSDKTVLDALAVMECGSKAAREEIEAAYQVYPDIGRIAVVLKEKGREGLTREMTVTVGVPVMPALCQRLKSTTEMIEKMGEVFVEPKYDGTRVGIHLNKSGNDWNVKTFTRNLEETTWMFPELQTAGEVIDASQVILDSEAVGYNPKTGKLLPFQETITRKRKHEIEATQGKVPLRFFVFDILALNGESQLTKPLWQRREMLRSLIKTNPTIVVTAAIRTTDPGEIQRFHQEQLSQGYEGVVVKQVNGTYEPGRRAFNWVKLKEAETQNGKLSDTVDAVVMGFYRGRGKRAAFGLGAFLVGVQDEVGAIKTVAKIGTGLSDEQWRELKKRLDNEVSAEKPPLYEVNPALVPDVWVEPNIVVEIAADEITRSPVHTAGGALRFPRLVQFREDRRLNDITTVVELIRIKGAA